MKISNNNVLNIIPGLLICTFLFLSSSKQVLQFPEAEITNGIIRAKVYLPDQEKGYYQGTRFDWSGVIPHLEYQGHTYFGQWFPKYDPKIHDAISGPVEEFNPIGYEKAKPGENFLKIGVGTLRKLDDKDYRFSAPYEVVDHGKWSVKKKKDRVEFKHELTDAAGYSYVYHKNLKLSKVKPELILEHSLKNTGKNIIDTKVYNHNFFMIDDQEIGPAYTVTFPFNLKLKEINRGIGDIAEIKDNKIIYNRTFNKGESVHCYLEGFGNSASDYKIEILNSNTGAGVIITSDQPISDLAYWSISTTLCPEPYIKVTVKPREEFKWNTYYNYFIESDQASGK
ncbi:hypothetical protein BH23BAC1_BH23BAC1_19830 [soil metagenome]